MVLGDGTTVVVKAYQPRWTRPFLVAVRAAQQALADAALPVARPLAGPVPLGRGLATIESHLPDPGQPSQYGAREMTASAVGFAAVLDAVPRLEELATHPFLVPHGGLYPVPHSPVFDFDATAEGAEWIDDLARAVAHRRGRGRRVVAHTDWSARNIRLSAEGVRAIYDLDSLALVALPAALATAAMTWRFTAEEGEGPAPGVDEIDEWLDRCPVDLPDGERPAVFAEVVFQLAYTSRCEHAVDPEGLVHQRARPTLASEAPALLRRAGLA